MKASLRSTDLEGIVKVKSIVMFRERERDVKADNDMMMMISCFLEVLVPKGYRFRILTTFSGGNSGDS